MDKRIESYLDSVIPEKLSKKRQKLIREELRDHISDHIDFYTEIGYGEDESVEKALTDMGDDGGVTEMIKKDFEKVYGEKIWMPILAFVLTAGIGSLLYLFASFLFGTSFSDACSALVGFAAMLGVSLVMSAAYRKGFRKTVLAMGLSGAMFGLPFVTPDPQLPSMYSGFVDALFYDGCYILEKIMPMSLYPAVEFYDYDILAVFGSATFGIGFAVAAVVLYIRLRKDGLPKEKSKKSTAIKISVVCVAAIAVALTCRGAENFFNSYIYVMNGYKFETSDGICKQSEAVFDSIELGMSYDEAKLKLRVQGYMPFDEYCETQSFGMRKRLKYSLNELDLAVTDEGYTVFVNPNVFYDYSGIDGRNYSNGFVYLRVDSDGCVESKGVGSGTKPGDGSYTATFSSDDNSDGITEGIVENCSVSSKFFTLKDGVTTRKYVVTPGRPYRIEDML